MRSVSVNATAQTQRHPTSHSPLSVAIGLGSNCGDRIRFLREAVQRLKGSVKPVRISSVYESEPLGCPPESQRFLNAVVLGITRLGPKELLTALQKIEGSMGRQRRQRNAPRTIDLDLIVYSGVVASEAGLTIPHSRFAARNFVLVPLKELDVMWCDPMTGTRINSLSGEGDLKLYTSALHENPLRPTVY